MKPVLILYATREGHTRRVAEHLAGFLQARGIAAEMVDAARVPNGFSLPRYCAAVIAASVHCGVHERELIRFVKDHVDALNRMPAALLSASLSEAGAEDIKSPPARRARAAADVQRMINALLQETGWHPGRVKAVAGALLFTKYNFLLRFVMKRISRQAGGATDTSKDHEYTDWKALDDFIDEFVQAIPTLGPARGAIQRVPSPSDIDARIRTFP
jgi:menaquinone-dependent protoporphyrinogen oxidase